MKIKATMILVPIKKKHIFLGGEILFFIFKRLNSELLSGLTMSLSLFLAVSHKILSLTQAHESHTPFICLYF